jgi:predicted DNA-binding mobile mystery protein A
MSTADLAARLEVAPSTVNRFELNERAGRIQLDTLTKVAEALDCDVVYALVPRRRLEEIVDDRARTLAMRELAAVGHTMDLEAQGVSAERMVERTRELAEELKGRPGLWRDPVDA